MGTIQHKLRLSKFNRRHDVDFYIHLIMKAASVGDTKKLLTIFFHDMLIVDRVKPSHLLVHILLKKLAELGGHSEAAFRIVRKMSDIRLSPTSVTYSLLFKNCAKEIANNQLRYRLSNRSVELVSPDEMTVIQRPAVAAFQLWQRLQQTRRETSGTRGIALRNNAVNSLLLVLSRARMLQQSCLVLDEFLLDGGRPCDYTLCAMLEGCLHDERSGLGLALALFHRLVYHHRCPLSPHVLSTFLKVVANCQLGNSLIVDTVVQLSSTTSATTSKQSMSALHSISIDTASSSSLSSAVSATVQTDASIHNGSSDYNAIIAKSAQKYGLQYADAFVEQRWSPASSECYALKSPTNMLQKRFNNVFNPLWLQQKLTPSDKLALIGGVLGVIAILEQNSLSPNVVVLTDLIRCLPFDNISVDPGESNEFFAAVIRQLSVHFKLSADRAFNNALYKRQITTGVNVQPEQIDPATFDPFTWSIYSRKCRTLDDVKSFFQLLAANQVTPNREIYFTLLRSLSSWAGRLHVLQRMHRGGVVFDRAIIVEVEDRIGKTRDKIKSMSATEVETTNFGAFYEFQKLYSHMIQSMEIEAVTTGDRKIVITDLPEGYRPR